MFCLSLEEAESLFSDDAARKCMPTWYASYASGEYEPCGWLLRSTDGPHNHAPFVDSDGALHLANDRFFSNAYGTVRPAIWVNL